MEILFAFWIAVGIAFLKPKSKLQPYVPKVGRRLEREFLNWLKGIR